jgi:hypothetical protein
MKLEKIELGHQFNAEEVERLIPDFPDYFLGLPEGYFLVRTPTPEFLDALNEEREIQAMAKIDDMDAFQRAVAEHLAKNLSEEDKKTILEDPEYTKYHFGYGMYIRNKYIHGRNIQANNGKGFVMPADSISADIFHELVKILKKAA